MDQQIVHVAVYDALADWEVGYATAHINNPEWQRQPGRYRVVTVGETGEAITTMGGMRVLPDMALADVSATDSAMLILPGAGSWDAGQNGEFGRLARQFLDAGVPVAAICGGTFGLAREGLLNDRAHTSNVSFYLQQASEYHGTELYRDEPAVTDRGLITAGSTAPIAFARDVLAALETYSPAVLDAWYGLFSTGQPEYFFALQEAAGQQVPAGKV
jgi:putative intracellular protease/amidase